VPRGDDVPVTLEVVPDVPHVFQGFSAILDEADAAITRAASFMKEHFVAT
jgi:epsilon-lactone hydrolase